MEYNDLYFNNKHYLLKGNNTILQKYFRICSLSLDNINLSIMFIDRIKKISYQYKINYLNNYFEEEIRNPVFCLVGKFVKSTNASYTSVVSQRAFNIKTFLGRLVSVIQNNTNNSSIQDQVFSSKY